MGAIIRMNSKKFTKELIPNHSHEKFQFILASEFIKTNGEFKNVQKVTSLMPPQNVLRLFVEGNEKAYKKAYLNYLQKDKIDSFIAILVKAAVIDDMNIVILCSLSEDEFKYVKMVCEYIESAYKMKTYTFKDFIKDEDKARKIENRKDVEKIIKSKIENIKESGINVTQTRSKEEYIEGFKDIGRKAMLKFAKTHKIKIDKDLDKTEMAKKLAKKIMKQ